MATLDSGGQKQCPEFRRSTTDRPLRTANDRCRRGVRASYVHRACIVHASCVQRACIVRASCVCQGSMGARAQRLQGDPGRWLLAFPCLFLVFLTRPKKDRRKTGESLRKRRHKDEEATVDPSFHPLSMVFPPSPFRLFYARFKDH